MPFYGINVLFVFFLVSFRICFVLISVFLFVLILFFGSIFVYFDLASFHWSIYSGG